MTYMRNLLPTASPWFAFGISLHQFPMVAQAVLLGGHVRVGLEKQLLGEAEIGNNRSHLSVAALGQHDIVALQIAVKNPFLVDGGQSETDLSRHLTCVVGGERTGTSEASRQRFTFDKFEDEVACAVRFFEFVDGGDIRVVQ